MARYIDMGTKGKANAWRKEFEAREQAAWNQFMRDTSNKEAAANWKKASAVLDANLRAQEA